MQDVPCGRCTPCQTLNKLQWLTRLQWTDKFSHDGAQLTLTYNDENLPRFEAVDHESGEILGYLMKIKNKDMKEFLHKLRNRDRKNRLKRPVPGLPKMTIFAVSELCPSSGRPHYHAIIHNFHPDTKLRDQDYVSELWSKGHVTAKPIHKIDYVLKDFVKQYNPQAEKIDGDEKSIRFISNGIGMPYLERYAEMHLKDNNPYMNTRSGPMVMPAYFLRKLWPDKTVNQILGIGHFKKWQIDNLKFNDMLRLEAELIKKGYQSIEDAQTKRHEAEIKKREFFHPKGITGFQK